MDFNTTVLVGVLAAAMGYFTSSYWLRFFRKPPRVEGFFRPEFRPVAEQFRENLESGLESGGTFAAYVNGELVVDMWGGYTDYELDHYWKKYTVGNVASVTKLVASITFAKLVDNGYVSYDNPVSDYWPEFAQNGKSHVTVRMLLSHQAGVIGLSVPLTPEMIRDDWERVEEILAEQKPLFEPGSGTAYHAYTFGLYIDALAKKVDPKHRRLNQIFAEDIAEPFDIDFSIGIRKPEQYRVARESRQSFPRQLWAALWAPDYHRLVISVIFRQNPLFEANNLSIKDADKPGKWDDPDSKEIPYCSGQGFGTARSLAKLTGILANGGTYQGRRLLSAGVLDDFSRVAVSGDDMALKRPARRGSGVWIVKNPWGDDVFGHPGFGGQMSYVDRKNKVGLAYITNHFSLFSLGDDHRFRAIEEVFYRCLNRMS